MTELEMIQRAKMYLDKLANGIDPLSDKPVPETDCINQVRLSRCLFFVSDVLRRVIENGGIGKQQKPKRPEFTITPETLSRYPFDPSPVSVSEIAKRINDLVDSENMSKLKYSSITAFLVKNEYLVEEYFPDGHKTKSPTELGQSVGIKREERTGQRGIYYVTVYDVQAQKLILDNIDAIIEINRPASGELPELQGEPWTVEQDDLLVQWFHQNIPVSEMAPKLKRTEPAVRARLKRLGLIEHRGDAI